MFLSESVKSCSWSVLLNHRIGSIWDLGLHMRIAIYITPVITFDLLSHLSSFILNTAATLGTTLSRHRMKPRVYIGCMKSGPVLARK